MFCGAAGGQNLSEGTIFVGKDNMCRKGQNVSERTIFVVQLGAKMWGKICRKGQYVSERAKCVGKKKLKNL